MRHRERFAGPLRGAIAAAIVMMAMLAAGAAGADEAEAPEARARAAAAYDRGVAAHARGDDATAARELAAADAIVPSPVTLEAALESAMAAGDAVLAIELGDRSQRAPASAALAARVREARARFEKRVGRLRVACPVADDGAPCVVSIDGARTGADRAVVVRPGRHVVRAERGGRVEERAVEVEAAGTASVVIAFAAPTAAPSTTSTAAPDRPSIAWFASALGATAIAGGLTIGFGVDAAAKHTRFTSEGCPGPVHGDCSALASSGQAAELRTNVMIGVTSALAATSVIAGVLTFRARGGDRAALILGGPQIAALRVPLP